MISCFLFFCFSAFAFFKLGESCLHIPASQNIGLSRALAGAVPQEEEKEEDAIFFTQLVIFFKTCAGT